MQAQFWKRIDHADPRAVAIADRHYSRQSPGSPEFTPPGNKIALIHYADDDTIAAIWASQRPEPGTVTRADGLDVWACSLFRVETRTVLASDLIREAVAITRSIWTPLPRDGFYTTIDPRHVRSQGRKRGYGWTYRMAGWQLRPERTKDKNLIVLLLPVEQLAAVPIVSWVWDKPIFGNVRKRWPRPLAPEEQAQLL